MTDERLYPLLLDEIPPPYAPEIPSRVSTVETQTTVVDVPAAQQPRRSQIRTEPRNEVDQVFNQPLAKYNAWKMLYIYEKIKTSNKLCNFLIQFSFLFVFFGIVFFLGDLAVFLFKKFL